MSPKKLSCILAHSTMGCNINLGSGWLLRPSDRLRRRRFRFCGRFWQGFRIPGSTSGRLPGRRFFTSTSPKGIMTFSLRLGKMVRSILALRMPMLVVSAKIRASMPGTSSTLQYHGAAMLGDFSSYIQGCSGRLLRLLQKGAPLRSQGLHRCNRRCWFPVCR